MVGVCCGMNMGLRREVREMKAVDLKVDQLSFGIAVVLLDQIHEIKCRRMNSEPEMQLQMRKDPLYCLPLAVC